MISVEYGIFTDEGLLEGDLWDENQATLRNLEYREEGEQSYVGQVCSRCRWAETYMWDECADCLGEENGE